MENSRMKKFTQQKIVRNHFIYFCVHLLVLFMIVYLIGAVTTPTSAMLNDTEKYLYRVQTAEEFPVDEELLRLLEEMLRLEDELALDEDEEGMDEEASSDDETNRDEDGNSDDEANRAKEPNSEDETIEDPGDPAHETEEGQEADDENTHASEDNNAQPSEQQENASQEMGGSSQEAEGSSPDDEPTSEQPADVSSGELSEEEEGDTKGSEQPNQEVN